MRKRYTTPDNQGRFGDFGGKFVPETLMKALEELTKEFKKLTRDSSFKKELEDVLENYAGRPTPLTYAKNLSQDLGGAQIYLKREDLLHTGARSSRR